MSDRNVSINFGFPLISLVFLILMTLKLAEIGAVADWSWWWVTAPLWVPVAIGAAALLCVGLGFLVFRILDR